jgi:hypothetical protein
MSLAGEAPRTLESVAVGESVALATFPFDTLRSLCADLGLTTGSVVRCIVASPAVLLLEREDGQQIRMDAGWARLIQVDSPSATGKVK